VQKLRDLSCILIVVWLAFMGCNRTKYTEIESRQKLKVIGMAIRDFERINGFLPSLTANKCEFIAIPQDQANWRIAILNRLIAIPASAERIELERVLYDSFVIQGRMLICFNRKGMEDSLQSTDAFSVVLYTIAVPNLKDFDFLAMDQVSEETSQQEAFVMFANGIVARVPHELMDELLRGKSVYDRGILEGRGVRFIGTDLDDFR
jgi:hypothetical protein